MRQSGVQAGVNGATMRRKSIALPSCGDTSGGGSKVDARRKSEHGDASSKS